MCALFDYEQWRRDHPRPVGKRLAALDVGCAAHGADDLLFAKMTIRIDAAMRLMDDENLMIRREFRLFMPSRCRRMDYGNTTLPL